VALALCGRRFRIDDAICWRIRKEGRSGRDDEDRWLVGIPGRSEVRF